MSEATATYTLTAAEIASVTTAFSESDEMIGARVFTVGNLTTEYAITPKQVFEQVNAHLELNAGQTKARPVKGWSASSIANAKTAYDLYAATGVSLTKGTKSARFEFAALVEDVRRLHGAKTVKTVIRDANALIAEDTITPDDRRAHFVTILTELNGRPAADKVSKVTTPEDRFLSALRAAISLATEVELTDEQAAQADALIAELNTFDLV